MKLSASKNTAGFSLTEVLFSLGIVATVILPIVAMLANGAASQVDSEDRIISSNLSESIIDQLIFSPQSDGLILLSGKNSSPDHPGEMKLPFPATSGEISSVFLVFKRSEKAIREIEERQFLSGIADENTGDVSSLVRVDIKKGSAPSPPLRQNAAPMYQIQISIEQPADAKVTSRSSEKFSTMISGQK